MSAAGEACADADAAAATANECRTQASLAQKSATSKWAYVEELFAESKKKEEEAKRLQQQAYEARREAEELKKVADGKEVESAEAQSVAKQKAEAASDAKASAEKAAAELTLHDDEEGSMSDEDNESRSSGP